VCHMAIYSLICVDTAITGATNGDQCRWEHLWAIPLKIQWNKGVFGRSSENGYSCKILANHTQINDDSIILKMINMVLVILEI
jgi:hypothetical protein